MLSIHYAPDVSPAMVEVLEHHARAAGLSLGALEVIGSSLDFVEGFIVASEDGQAQTWLAQMGLAPAADDDVTRARWQAAKIFG